MGSCCIQCDTFTQTLWADLLPAEVVEAGPETVAALSPLDFIAGLWKGSGSM